MVIFGLLLPSSQTNPPQVQHKIGLGYPALPTQQNPLPFFSLLASFSSHPPPHNRTVCGRNCILEFIYNRII
jgi:hypothetical protein